MLPSPSLRGLTITCPTSVQSLECAISIGRVCFNSFSLSTSSPFCRIECRRQTKFHVHWKTRGNAKSLTERCTANNDDARRISLADHLDHVLVCGCGSSEAHKQTVDGEATPCSDQPKSGHTQGPHFGVDKDSGRQHHQWLEGGGGHRKWWWRQQQQLEQAHKAREGRHTRADCPTLSTTPPPGQCQ